MARPRQPLLSRERIATTALAIIDSEGLESLSTRKLAAELGVSGPSLYNHMATKEALLDAVVDLVLAEVDIGMFDNLKPGEWVSALRTWARSYRAALAAHPNLVPALAPGPGHRPHALRIADVVFGGLVNAGWPRREATRIGALLRYFVTGSALGSFAGGFPDDAAVYHGEYPHLDEAHLLAERQDKINEAAFELGLSAILDGLSSRFPVER